MRSRSSRLFVVLLHLVGVSTNFPLNPFLAALHPDNLRSGVGIVGVHPLSILLEPLELQAAGGLGELLSLLEGAGYDVEKTVLGEPYWLQDDTDGKCLGPDGFSECGDATLWKIKRRPATYTSLAETRRRQHKSSSQSQSQSQVSIRNKYDETTATSQFLAIFGWGSTSSFGKSNIDDNEEDLLGGENVTWEYALELVEVNSSSPFGLTNSKGEQEDGSENDNGNENGQEDSSGVAECVVSYAVTEENQSGILEMGPCSSDDAWSWSINEGGVLKWDEKVNIQDKLDRRNKDKGRLLLGGPMARLMQMASDIQDDELREGDKPTQCLWRFNETSARTEPCDASTIDTQEATNRRLVGLSVIQYQNSAAVSPKLPRFSDGTNQYNQNNSGERREEPTAKSEREQSHESENKVDDESHLPHRQSHSTSRSTSDSNHQPKAPLGVGGYFAHPQLNKKSSGRNTASSDKKPLNKPVNKLTPIGVGLFQESLQLGGDSKNAKKGKVNLLHHPPSPSSTVSPNLHQDTPHKPRKIPVHPYIAASKDGLYEDTATGLMFPTDLHSYLGHERSVSGRHTLMGVGLFTKTMLKIKVYSVGLYVPKRDVLADSSFAPFADMSVEELRKSDGFYNALMNEGTTDKTLFIQLNMQLATETVRQSLSAEWQLLSNDHKEQLSSSSARPRDADERMLETIQKEDNTSNCSCGQTAPPEYEADPSCCARGTEMVFTWRKNGNLELRIDGRVMDTFTDPIIGKGILWEYVRGDDPMSRDARDHFADGFPFLLAPLAQVRGISSSVPNHQDSLSETKKEKKAPRIKIGKLTYDVFGNISTRVSDVSAWTQDNINGGVANIGNAIGAVSTTTQNLGAEIERRRESLMSHFSRDQIMNSTTTMQEQSGRSFMSRLSFWRRRPEPKNEAEGRKENETKAKSPKRKTDFFRHHLAKMLDESSTKRPVSDEIGVIIQPTMSSTHLLFLYMVHFYLVLLLIVSVPDLHTNRLVVRRSSVSTVDSESDHEERLTELDGIPCDISCSWDNLSIDKNDEVPKYVVKKSDHERENDCTQLSTSNLKKSLSYYL